MCESVVSNIAVLGRRFGPHQEHHFKYIGTSLQIYWNISTGPGTAVEEES